MSQPLTIPGVGEFFVSYDRLRLLSSASPYELRRVLTDAGFKKWVHDFQVKRPPWRSTGYRSRLEFTPVNGSTALEWLELNEGLLGSYSFTKVEVACDGAATEIAMLRELMARLIKTIAKPRATRGHLLAAREGAKRQFKAPDPDQATIYVENRGSSVALKFYSRFAKAPDGKLTNDMLARMELTIARSSAVRSKLGGSHVTDLLKANLPKVVRKQLHLETVDPVEVGNLVGTAMNDKRPMSQGASHWPVPRGYANKDDYLATRRAYMMLRHYAANRFYDELRLYTARKRRLLPNWEDILLTGLQSPIEIRSVLKKLQQSNPAITNYRINKCFRRIAWRKRVRIPLLKKVRLPLRRRMRL